MSDFQSVPKASSKLIFTLERTCVKNIMFGKLKQKRGLLFWFPASEVQSFAPANRETRQTLKWRHPKYAIDIWQIDGLPWVRDNFVSKNFEEIVSLVKFLNNIRWKICSQRRFLEFLQNSSEFVVATVLRNPIGNLISLAEFHIFVEFPPKTILGSSIMYKFLWKRDRLYWILGTALKIEAVIHIVNICSCVDHFRIDENLEWGSFNELSLSHSQGHS